MLYLLIAVGPVTPARGAGAQNLLHNPGFERVQPAPAGAKGPVNGWTVGDGGLVPRSWLLNSAYPGRLTIGSDHPRTGKRYVRIAAGDKRAAHLFQPCPSLQPNHWYRVSLWVRGGPVVAHFYEYFKDGHIGGQRVLQGSSSTGKWRELSGYYCPGGEGYKHSALALYVEKNHEAEIDDVLIEPVSLKDLPPPGEDLSFENEVVRWTVTGSGRLKSLQDLVSHREYAAEAPLTIFSVLRQGTFVPARSIRQRGDELHVRFLDPDVKAVVRVSTGRHHFVMEVVSVSPADVDELSVQFPVNRLANVAPAFNGTYDDDFGMCLFGATVNVHNTGMSHRGAVRALRCSCYRAHGMVGARFALVAAPRLQFNAAIMEAERATGLPCPMLNGKWARESDAVRQSYLFSTGTRERDVDTLIRYAKIGGFGAIIFLKSDWLETHGHYRLNKKNFPDGLASLRRVVDKIHAAGLSAGVHVFGPSISPTDPYITPTPDERLASVPCPPLAEAVEADTTTLTLTGQPDLPPKTVRTRAFPGYFLRIGDELIRYGEVDVGPPFRYLKCRRGALGTRAAAHPAGAEVKGLLTMWNYFLVDPDSSLVDDLTGNFAAVFNAADFDMVYFDASDGIQSPYFDRWYYLNKLHLSFYRKFKKDVLYQTSNGTGFDILWHLVPRSASADGHGDIKGYLDQRWPGILGQARNFTRSDVGWYYWFKDVRPDQMEYVAAKVLGIEGSLSVETSRTALESQIQSRQMMEMLGRWQRCRLAHVFPESVRAKLREPRHDFKLFEPTPGKWQLYRAAYEPPRSVPVLDGRQNHWTIRNDAQAPCVLGVELVRGVKPVAVAGYDDPGALTLETFADLDVYRPGKANRFGRYVVGPEKTKTPAGPTRRGTTQRIARTTTGTKVGRQCLVYSAANTDVPNGWCGIGRRFVPPKDLHRFKGVGLWIHGDGKFETIRIQFRDTAGHSADFLPAIDFTGWRLFTYRLPADKPFDWSRTEYLLFYFNAIPRNTSVQVLLDTVKLLPELTTPVELGKPVITVNGKRTVLPVTPKPGQALSTESPVGVTLWPGGMEPGRRYTLPAPLTLRRGLNEITFSHTGAKPFCGDLTVLLYRMWPLEVPGPGA